MADLEPEQQTSSVRVGDIVAGKYRVERLLGTGGMGIVVAAMHEQLQQLVAIKLLRVAALKNPEALERFKREARAASALRGEHLARVFDISTLENGLPYMVLEHLEGKDLADVLAERGPLPIGEATSYMLQVCEGVAEAHKLGIIHRDLKPRNLFLTLRADGRPLLKVLDFGISKVMDTTDESMSLTQDASIVGTPNYMSPEQLRSARGVDARSDIWSLGVVLYELLSGRRPFEAASVTALCSQVFEEQPVPLRSVREDVPAELAEIVHRCLEKHPPRRFQTVGELAHALEPFAVDRATPGPADRIRALEASSARALSEGSSPRPGNPTVITAEPTAIAVVEGTAVSWTEGSVAGALGRTKRARKRASVAVAGSLVVLLATVLLVLRHAEPAAVTAQAPLPDTADAASLLTPPATAAAVSAHVDPPSPTPAPQPAHTATSPRFAAPARADGGIARPKGPRPRPLGAPAERF